MVMLGFPCGSPGKKTACYVGDLGSIPGLGRSPGEGKGYPLQNSVDCVVHGAAKNWTQVSDFHFHGYARTSLLHWDLLQFQQAGATLQCLGFSLWWLVLLQSIGSRVHGLSSCGTPVYLPCSMCNLPGPRITPVSPALAGRFLTNAPPVKSKRINLKSSQHIYTHTQL